MSACCKHTPPEVDKPALIPSPKQIFHGLIEVVKSTLDIGVASLEVIGQRRVVCYGCDRLNRGLVNQCRECLCVVEEKTRRKDEKCPLGKWAE